MNVRELTFKGEDEVRLFACGKCGRCVSPKLFMAPKDVQMQTARRIAEECCAEKTCGDCGVNIGQSARTICDACHERRKLSQGTGGSWGEGYSGSIDDLLEWCHDHDEPIPAYVHPCKGDPMRFDPEGLLMNLVEDHHEDAGDQIVDEQAFHDFINAWNEKQTCVSYYPDFGRYMVLHRGRFDEILNPPSTDEGDETEEE